MVFGFSLSFPRLGVVTHPNVFFILPFAELFSRQSIGQTVSDKVEDIILLPMRKMVLVDIDVGIGVEERRAGILPVFFLNAGCKPALLSLSHLILSKSPSGQLLSKYVSVGS